MGYPTAQITDEIPSDLVQLVAPDGYTFLTNVINLIKTSSVDDVLSMINDWLHQPATAVTASGNELHTYGASPPTPTVLPGLRTQVTPPLGPGSAPAITPVPALPTRDRLPPPIVQNAQGEQSRRDPEAQPARAGASGILAAVVNAACSWPVMAGLSVMAIYNPAAGRALAIREGVCSGAIDPQQMLDLLRQLGSSVMDWVLPSGMASSSSKGTIMATYGLLGAASAHHFSVEEQVAANNQLGRLDPDALVTRALTQHNILTHLPIPKLVADPVQNLALWALFIALESGDPALVGSVLRSSNEEVHLSPRARAALATAAVQRALTPESV